MADRRLGSLVMEDGGDGPPVLMIHGLGGDSNSFQPLMPALDGYRVLRPDLPGAGRSVIRPGQPGLQGLVKALRDCLKLAGVARVHLVGHSMGTLLCQYLAVDSGATIASMTLFGPILEPPTAARAALRERAATVRAEGMASTADAVSRGSVAPATHAGNPVVAAFVRESLMRQDPSGYAAHSQALSEAKPADHPAIACPTLLIAGAADPIAPVAMARELENRIAGARLEVVPEVGHWIMLEAPQRSAALMRGHLETNPL